MKNYKLMTYRKKLGLTQRQIADKIGISLTSYCQKENGREVFDQKEMKALLKIIKEKYPLATIQELFFEE